MYKKFLLIAVLVTLIVTGLRADLAEDLHDDSSIIVPVTKRLADYNIPGLDATFHLYSIKPMDVV